MNNKTKTLTLSIMTALLLVLSLTSASIVNAATNYTLNDNSNDVITFTLNNGVPTSYSIVSEGSVDLTSASISFSLTSSTNSTISMTFSGTPSVDEYHYYWVWISGAGYMAGNTTHYLGFLIYVSITGMTDDPGADLTLFHGLYSIGNPDQGDYLYFGVVNKKITYLVDGSALILSFNITGLIENQNFLQLWETVTDIDLSQDNPFQTQYSVDAGFMAYAYKTNVANQAYDAQSGTYWWDFMPDDQSSNFIPISGDNASGDSGEDQGETSITDSNSDLNETDDGGSLPTPGFEVIEFFAFGFTLIIAMRVLKIGTKRPKDKSS